MNTPRDYSSISPSAKALLLLKAQAVPPVPYAREAATLLWGPETVEAAGKEMAASPGGDARAVHFAMRARSLDDALHDVGATRVLEIAAGLSLRGLAMAAKGRVFYLDTDLPGIASIKQELVGKLHTAPLAGALTVRPLDALDPAAFDAAVAELPEGPIAIVHEGLLMYLDDAEKARLAASVRKALDARGGWWITADVYVQSETHLFRDERTKKFLQDHRVEERKFRDYAAAEAFFTKSGFSIQRRSGAGGETWRVRETWAMTRPPPES